MSLHSLGPFYPATAESVSESPFSGTSCTWVTPAQVSSDSAACAFVTDAAFDANVKTWVLKAYNFPFSGIPDAASIVGVVADFNAQWVAGTNPIKISLGQLLTNQRTKGGTNQYATPEDMSAALTTHSKGSTSDLWGNALSAAWVKHSGFGVAYGCSAISNNSDVCANYVKLTITYSIPDSYTMTSDGVNIIVTPQAGSSFAPGAGPAAYPYAGSVQASVKPTINLQILKVLDLGYNQVKVVSDSTYSKGGAGATAYPYTGAVEVEPAVDSVRSKSKVTEGVVEVKPAVDSVRSKSKVYTTSVEVKPEVDSQHKRDISYRGTVEAEPIADSVLAKSKSPSTSVEVDADTTSDHTRSIFRDGSVEADVAADSAYVYAPAGGGIAHPYAGTIEANVTDGTGSVSKGKSKSGSIELNVTDGTGSVAKSRVRDGSVEAETDATSAHSRSKSYTGSIEAKPEISSVLSKSKSYPGSVEAEALSDSTRYRNKSAVGSVETEAFAQAERIVGRIRTGTAETNITASSERNRSKVYIGSIEAILGPDSVRYKGKVYAGSHSTVIVLDSVYSKVTPGVNVYAGSVEATVSGSSKVAVGKAYQSGANLVVELGGAYSFVHPTASVYSGDVQSIASVEGSYSKAGKATYQYSGTIYLTVDPKSAYLFQSSVVVIPFRYTEPKPHDGYILETLPGSPGSQDGAYTDPLQDGAWTEEPVDGAYTQIGYEKEFKPFTRYTHINESVPTRPAGVDGAYTDPLQDGAWDEFPVDGMYTQIGYEKEFKPFHRASMTKEGKPI